MSSVISFNVNNINTGKSSNVQISPTTYNPLALSSDNISSNGNWNYYLYKNTGDIDNISINLDNTLTWYVCLLGNGGVGGSNGSIINDTLTQSSYGGGGGGGQCLLLNLGINNPYNNYIVNLLPLGSPTNPSYPNTNISINYFLDYLYPETISFTFNTGYGENGTSGEIYTYDSTTNIFTSGNGGNGGNGGTDGSTNYPDNTGNIVYNYFGGAGGNGGNAGALSPSLNGATYKMGINGNPGISYNPAPNASVGPTNSSYTPVTFADGLQGYIGNSGTEGNSGDLSTIMFYYMN
jgi:hypothetical protein